MPRLHAEQRSLSSSGGLLVCFFAASFPILRGSQYIYCTFQTLLSFLPIRFLILRGSLYIKKHLARLEVKRNRHVSATRWPKTRNLYLSQVVQSLYHLSLFTCSYSRSKSVFILKLASPCVVINRLFLYLTGNRFTLC